MDAQKRLYRSTRTKVFGGVAGGIAEYFNIDPIIIRILFVAIALAGGSGALVYLILWIAIPLEPINPNFFNTNPADVSSYGTPYSTPTATPDNGDSPFKGENRSSLIAGILLIVLGFIFLVDRFIPNIHFGDIWPLLLVAIGGVLIATSLNERKKDAATPTFTNTVKTEPKTEEPVKDETFDQHEEL